MTWMTRQELLRYIRSPGVGKLLELARVREQHREAGEPLPDLFEQEERGRRGGLESQRRRREKQQAEEAAWQAKVEAARLFRQGSR